jgi:hypothetical protein
MPWQGREAGMDVGRVAKELFSSGYLLGESVLLAVESLESRESPAASGDASGDASGGASGGASGDASGVADGAGSR